MKEMPKRLNLNGVKRLCYEILYQAIDDAGETDKKRQKDKSEALWFVGTNWCMTICETYEIDYKSYANRVRQCKKTPRYISKEERVYV